MIALIQRVSEARVRIDDRECASIGPGLAVFVGIARADSAASAEKLLRRVLGYRLFPDASGRMNLSVADIAGGLLLVPNFTLLADTSKGTRPSFTPAAAPDQAQPLFEGLVRQAREQHRTVACGVFGADMQVELINDGPVTVSLHS